MNRGDVCLSLGSAFPGKSPEYAMEHITQNRHIPIFGEVCLDHVQICPQNYAGGPMNMERLHQLQKTYPRTQFRLHANARLLEKGCPYDLGTAHRFPDYAEALCTILRHLDQPYSLHAANNGTPIARQISNAKKLSRISGVPVAIEGLYPGHRANTMSSWEDYASLLVSGLPYALDLSHLNIVRHYYGEAPNGLVKSLVEHPDCLEIHISGNDGSQDKHLPCDGSEWWIDLLNSTHENAVVFYEGRII